MKVNPEIQIELADLVGEDEADSLYEKYREVIYRLSPTHSPDEIAESVVESNARGITTARWIAHIDANEFHTSEHPNAYYDDLFNDYETLIIRKYNEESLRLDKAQQHLRTLGRWEEVAVERGLIQPVNIEEEGEEQ